MAEKMKNKYTKNAMITSALSVGFIFVAPIIDLIAAVFALIFGIISLNKIKKGTETDGKTGAIVSIIISILVLSRGLAEIFLKFTLF